MKNNNNAKPDKILCKPEQPAYPRTFFTLIEMLVVIAIISILASMLMPQLKNSINSARKVSCTNNLKQTFMAIRMYADANNDYYPPIDQVGAAPPRWHGTLYNLGYIEQSLMQCPSQSKRPDNWWLNNPDYGMNHAMADSLSGVSYKLSTQKMPKIKMFILDTWRNNADGSANEDSGLWRFNSSASATTWQGQPSSRHQQSCNTLFVDGHTEFLDIIEGLSVYSQKPFRYFEDREYYKWDTPAWSLNLD